MRALVLFGVVVGALVALLWARPAMVQGGAPPRLNYITTAHQLGVVGYRDPVGVISPDATRLAPRWSPDGQTVLLDGARKSDGRSVVYAIGVNQDTGSVTSELREVAADGTSDPSHKTQPAWSPDGARIAFTVWSYEAVFFTMR